MIDNPDPLGPLGQAFLASQSQADREALSDLSAQEINSMPFGEFARRTGRPTPAQAALNAYENHAQPGAAGRSSAPAGDSPSSNSDAPVAVSVAPEGITDEQFLDWRSQRGNQGEGQGLFSGLGGSGSAEYRHAATRRAGRNAMVTSNVQGPSVPATREQMIANMRQTEQDRLQSGRRQYYR